MVWLLRRCSKCSKYTLNQEVCPVCGGSVVMPHPGKFSLDDRYQHLKLKMRRLSRQKTQ